MKNILNYAVAFCIIIATYSLPTAASEKLNTIMGYPAGGGTDSSFQTFSKYMSAQSNLEFEPNYIVGASGLVSMKYFFDSKDNNQLTWVGSGLSIGNSVIYKQPKYSLKDIRPVVLSMNTPLLFVKSPKSNKIKKFADLFDKKCDKRIVVSVSGLMHEIAGKILQKTSTCEIALSKYKGDTAPITDIINGSVDIGVLPLLTSQTIVEQNGIILASTANPKDENWKQYTHFSTHVKGANIYLEYGLWASKNMSDAKYKKLIEEIKKHWSNKKKRESQVKFKPGYKAKELYGDDYAKFLSESVNDLKKLAIELDIQR